MNQIHSHRYENGITLLVEPIEGVESVGMTILVPAGSSCEPDDCRGLGSVLSEMLFRGAGDLDARAHSDALDQLGIMRGSAVQTHHISLNATFLGDRFDDAIPLLLDIIRHPILPDDAFEPARELAIQGIDALEDEPQQKVMIELKKAHMPQPLGRSPLGCRDHLVQMSYPKITDYYTQRFVPDNLIITFAGKVDFSHARDKISQLLGDWHGTAKQPSILNTTESDTLYFPAKTAQQHIGIAYDAIPETDPMSMTQRIAIAILSGGMSGRLFTEVREKRGLCYSVFASYISFLDRGMIFAYAGTTPQRAKETLDVMTHELQRLSDGVDSDEFYRAVVGLKTRIVMQGESTLSRATSIASDHFLLGSPRTLDKLESQIDAVTLDNLNQFLKQHPADNFTILTVGPEPLST